jgi:TPR repeat protein
MKRFAILLSMLLILPGAVMAQKGPFQGGKSGTEQVSAEKLSKAEKDYNASKKAFEKNKKDAKLKKKYVDSTNTFALANMYSATLSTKVKYRNALKYFREVLSVEPKNKIAREQSDMIISIYQQMGLPIPK